MEDLRYWLALLRVPKLGPATIQKIITTLGSAAEIFRHASSVCHDFGLSAITLDALQHPDWVAISRDLAWAEQDRHYIVTQADSAYPPLLKHIAVAPSLLFVQGNLACLQTPQLAMVGSRNPTHHARENALYFAAAIAQAGLNITSGLALGIDTASHQGALTTSANTIAVAATGLDMIYPRSNRLLADAICEQGAMVSEFCLGTLPRPENFPRRNRIISGLSVGVFVVEAALKSGSLITARYANEQGREVFAMPGSIHNPLAKGCHWLIKQGAKLVENIDDIFNELTGHFRLPSPQGVATHPLVSGLSVVEKQVWQALEDTAVKIDTIVARTGLSVEQVATILTKLELQGKVKSFNNGYIALSP